ncbi:unnamed protein product [Adineta steineri]|uniref:Uncharacterized protein n=1 Tax=Adineta steineri TaxID=433720 RepID=A0A819T393_9BILA|nr:unnamed protein product [Adineta steineri]
MEIYLRDMGVSLYRTNNWISEYFGVYRPKRLSTLHDERKAKAEEKTRNFCLSDKIFSDNIFKNKEETKVLFIL